MKGPFRIDEFDYRADSAGKVTKTLPERAAASTGATPKELRDLLSRKKNDLATSQTNLTSVQARVDTLTQEVADLQELLTTGGRP